MGWGQGKDRSLVHAFVTEYKALITLPLRAVTASNAIEIKGQKRNPATWDRSYVSLTVARHLSPDALDTCSVMDLRLVVTGDAGVCPEDQDEADSQRQGQRQGQRANETRIAGSPEIDVSRSGFTIYMSFLLPKPFLFLFLLLFLLFSREQSYGFPFPAKPDTALLVCIGKLKTPLVTATQRRSQAAAPQLMAERPLTAAKTGTHI